MTKIAEAVEDPPTPTDAERLDLAREALAGLEGLLLGVALASLDAAARDVVREKLEVAKDDIDAAFNLLGDLLSDRVAVEDLDDGGPAGTPT